MTQQVLICVLAAVWAAFGWSAAYLWNRNRHEGELAKQEEKIRAMQEVLRARDGRIAFWVD
jgi:hypothetical protein